MIENLKVLQVIGTLDRGGAERVFIDLCNLLYQNQIDVSILFTRKPGELSKNLLPEIPFVSLDRQKRFSITAIFKMINVINEYNIIHVHLRYNFIFLKLFSLFFNKKIKFVFHDHHGSIDIDKKIPFGFYFLKSNYYYIGVSQSLCDWASSILGVDNNYIFKLPNIRIIKHPYNFIGKKKDLIKLVHVSNIHRVKNIELSIEILKLMNLKKDTSLTIYGSLSDENYYNSLKVQISNYNLDNKVEFIFNENDIPSVLRDFDFALSTSKSESGPLVLIEYLSMGLPFLTYQTGEVVNQIIHRHPDLVMYNFNSQDWCDQIFQILNTNISGNLMRTYKSHFSSEKYFDSLISIYKNIIQNDSLHR